MPGPQRAWRSLSAVFAYGGPAREVILRFKHGHDFALARPLGTLMAAVALRERLLQEAELVVPVPAWPPRTVRRRYAAPALLAVEVGRRAGLPVGVRVLARVRPPSPDGHAGPRQRAECVRGAFVVQRPEAIRGRAILLVDDVVTTGATAAEVAATLLAAGASRVDVIAAALAGADDV